MYLIGIDVGTTHTKIGVYRPSGREIFAKGIPTPFKKTKDGGEISGEVLFSTILNLLKEFYFKFPQFRKEKGCLSVSSLGETVIPVSSDGNPLAPGLIWYDRRTLSVYRELLEKVKKEYFIKKLLKNPGYIYSINKMLWLKTSNRKLFDKVKWFLPVSSYVIFSLTKEACIDYSHAVRTMVFDPHTMDWDYELLKILEIDPALFPPLCKSGTFLGKVIPSIKEELGISEDIFVSSGGHDHLVAALYMGLFEKNVLFNSSGTTESIFLGIKREKIKDPDILSFLRKGDITCHTVPGFFTLITSMGTGGIAFKWFCEKLLGRNFSHISSLTYKENTVFFMPRVLEVHGNIPQSAFLSLGMEDDENILYSALMEALVFELKDRSLSLNVVEKELPSVLRISGGPTQNDKYNRLKSDLFEKRVEIPENREATLLGAALLGGIGGGIYSDFVEAHEATYRIDKIYEPEDNPYLRKKFQKYKELKRRYDKFFSDE